MESMEQLDLKDLWALLAFLEKLAPMDLLVCKDLRAVQELLVNPGLLAHPDSQGKRESKDLARRVKKEIPVCQV